MEPPTTVSGSGTDAAVTLPLAVGEGLRWYLRRARHPFKSYVVGHYWSAFCRPRMWIRYDRGRIAVSLRDHLQQRIFFDEYYERPLIQWLERSLSSADVFWDVGANIGAVSLVASRLCRQVVAFEPDPRSLASLTAHVRINRCDNVMVVPAALAETAGTATLFQADGRNTGMTSLHRREHVVGEIPVSVLRADDFVRDHPDLAPSVVKIDVEGAESLVLRGATALMGRRQLRAIIFESATHRDGHHPAPDLQRLLERAGFAIASIGPSDLETADGLANFIAVRDVR